MPDLKKLEWPAHVLHEVFGCHFQVSGLQHVQGFNHGSWDHVHAGVLWAKNNKVVGP
jgi:hypothetical protein